MAAAAVTQTPISGEAAAWLGSLIIAVISGLSGLTVWLNRKVTRRLNLQNADLAHAQAGKATVEAVMLLLDQVQKNAEAAMRQAHSAEARAGLAERQITALRKWASEVDAIVRSHGIKIPPLPDFDEGGSSGYVAGR